MLTREQIQRAAGEMGFAGDTLEKVWMLLGLLKLIYAHPFLGPRVALKGGTALNLFVFDLPRAMWTPGRPRSSKRLATFWARCFHSGSTSSRSSIASTRTARSVLSC